jgi:hypothetical protein
MKLFRESNSDQEGEKFLSTNLPVSVCYGIVHTVWEHLLIAKILRTNIFRVLSFDFELNNLLLSLYYAYSVQYISIYRTVNTFHRHTNETPFGFQDDYTCVDVFCTKGVSIQV